MPDLTAHSPLELAVAFALAVVASARFTRLVVHDDWPPTVWLRNWWRRTVSSDWTGLVECPFCFAPWVVLVDGAWAWAVDLDPVWWAANVWFAAAYLAAMVVLRDEPPAED